MTYQNIDDWNQDSEFEENWVNLFKDNQILGNRYDPFWCFKSSGGLIAWILSNTGPQPCCDSPNKFKQCHLLWNMEFLRSKSWHPARTAIFCFTLCKKGSLSIMILKLYTWYKSWGTFGIVLKGRFRFRFQIDVTE